MNPVVTSWRHHKDRLDRAVAAKDYSGMRDANKVLRDLEARMLPAEKQELGI